MKQLLLFLIMCISGMMLHAGDLDMFCLKGPVDSVCVIMNDAGLEWQTEYTFDSEGFLIELDGEEFDCERDSSGRMISIILEDSAEDDEEAFTTIEVKISYDNAGRVVKTSSSSADEQWTQSYHYDHNGVLKQRDYDIVGNEEILTYVYLKFDDYGNWTERIEKLGSMDQSIRQIRHITYGISQEQ